MENRYYLLVMFMLAISTSVAQQRPKLALITPKKIESFFYDRKEFMMFCLENGYTNSTSNIAPSIVSFRLEKNNPSYYEISDYIQVSRQQKQLPNSKDNFVRIWLSVDKETCSDYIENLTELFKEYFNKSELKEDDWVDGSGKQMYSASMHYTREGSEITFKLGDSGNMTYFIFFGVSSKVFE